MQKFDVKLLELINEAIRNSGHKTKKDAKTCFSMDKENGCLVITMPGIFPEHMYKDNDNIPTMRGNMIMNAIEMMGGWVGKHLHPDEHESIKEEAVDRFDEGLRRGRRIAEKEDEEDTKVMHINVDTKEQFEEIKGILETIADRVKKGKKE